MGDAPGGEQPYVPSAAPRPMFSASSVVPYPRIPDRSAASDAAYEHPTPRIGSGGTALEHYSAGRGYHPIGAGVTMAPAHPGYMQGLAHPVPTAGFARDRFPLVSPTSEVPVPVSHHFPDMPAPSELGQHPPVASGLGPEDGGWSRRASGASLAGNGTDVVTPLSANFSFGDNSSGGPSSTTSYDSLYQQELDVKRRSSCPADLLTSMGAFALSAVAETELPRSLGTTLPYTTHYPHVEHPIAQWSYAVQPSAVPEHLQDPGATYRRHSVSAMPWHDQQLADHLAATAAAAGSSDSSSPEIGRTPVPAHVYSTYARRGSSSSSVLLPIEEGVGVEPGADTTVMPTDGGAGAPGPFQRTYSSPGTLGIRRPPIERKARSQSSLRSVHNGFELGSAEESSGSSATPPMQPVPVPAGWAPAPGHF